jgi:hypothetical protein
MISGLHSMALATVMAWYADSMKNRVAKCDWEPRRREFFCIFNGPDTGIALALVGHHQRRKQR